MDPLEFESRISAMSRRRHSASEMEKEREFEGFKNGENFSKPRAFREKHKSDYDVNVVVSVSELQDKHKDEYSVWCLSGDKAIEIDTYNDYFNAVKRFGESIYSPKDISGYYSTNEIPLPEKVQKGAARLFRFLKMTLPPRERLLNDYPYDDFIMAFNEAKKAAGSRSENIAHNVTTTELKTWTQNIPDEFSTMFLMLAYSGARIEQLYNILKETDRKDREALTEIITPDDDDRLINPVFRLDVRKWSEDKKKTRHFYFPLEMKETVLNYKPSFSLEQLKKELGVNAPLRSDGKIISGKTLRKWNTNLMINNDVPAEVAGWIEGRVPNKHNSAAAVTWNNYADLDVLAARAYSRLEKIILSELPLDIFDSTAQVKKSPSGTGHENLIAGKNKTSSDRKEMIIRLCKSGKKQTEIAEELKASRNTVRQTLREAGLIT